MTTKRPNVRSESSGNLPHHRGPWASKPVVWAFPAFFVVALAAPSANAPPQPLASDRSEPCERKPARAFPVGAVTELEVRDPACTFVFRPTGVRFEAVLDGSRPDPGRRWVMDGRGRFYSANADGFQSIISVWDSQGNYLTSFGGEGDGPGEFSSLGALSLHVDSEDQLHVRDGGNTWSVLSAGHELLRRRSISPGTFLQDNRNAVLDGDGLLTSNHTSTDRNSYFHVLDADGALTRSFGPVSEEHARDRTWPIDRTIAYAGGDSFWAGPIPKRGEAGYYEVEEWGTDGTLKRILRRSASWFVPDNTRIPTNGVLQFHVDAEAGLLYVVFSRLTSEGERLMTKAVAENRRFPREFRYTETEAVVEMIDTRSGELLATEVYRISEAMQFIPEAMFRGVMQGHLRSETEGAGLPVVEVVAVELESR